MVAQYENIQCQILNWVSAQTAGVFHLASNFIKHEIMLLKHVLHRKRNIFRTFTPSTTSDKILHIIIQDAIKFPDFKNFQGIYPDFSQ